MFSVVAQSNRWTRVGEMKDVSRLIVATVPTLREAFEIQHARAAAAGKDATYRENAIRFEVVDDATGERKGLIDLYAATVGPLAFAALECLDWRDWSINLDTWFVEGCRI